VRSGTEAEVAGRRKRKMSSGSGKESILLIDDEKHLLISLRDFLASEGFEVKVAQSAEEGLKVVQSMSPDLIILDISMPGIGGLGFLREIAGPDGRPRYPVLVLTARSRLEEFFNKVDVDGFLAKPCEESVLLRRIREILAARRAAAGRTGQLKVMLAEDDHRPAEAIRAALEARGWLVSHVTSGPEVLEKAPIEKPDIIVMNEILPRLNGSAAASLLCVMPSLAGTRMVIYDETLSESEDLPPKYARLRSVKKVLHTREPSAIADAISEITG